MIRINLIPVRVTKKELAIRNQAAAAIATLLLAIGSIAYLQIRISGQIAEKDRAIDETKVALKNLEEKVNQIERFKQQKAELEKKLAIINQLVAGRTGPVYVMLEICLSTPEKLWLNKLNLSASQLEMSGIADTEKTVIEFTQNLKQQKHLGDVQINLLQGGKKSSPQGTLPEYVEFSLTTTVRLSG